MLAYRLHLTEAVKTSYPGTALTSTPLEVRTAATNWVKIQKVPLFLCLQAPVNPARLTTGWVKGT